MAYSLSSTGGTTQVRNPLQEEPYTLLQASPEGGVHIDRNVINLTCVQRFVFIQYIDKGIHVGRNTRSNPDFKSPYSLTSLELLVLFYKPSVSYKYDFYSICTQHRLTLFHISTYQGFKVIHIALHSLQYSFNR